MPFFETDHVRLHYLISGLPNAPWLVFHHSLGANLTQWQRHAALFGDAASILSFDARGHGRSSVPDGPYDIAGFGHDTLALLDHVGVGTFAFCGLSLGSMVGLWLAAHAPERVERMALAGATARVGGRQSFDARLARLQHSDLEPEMDELLARWFTPEFLSQQSPVVDAVRNMVLATPVAGYVAATCAVRDFDGRASLDRIECPLLLITGALDPATPVADAQYICDRVTGARLEVIDNASHVAQEQCPDAFDRLLPDFLR